MVSTSNNSKTNASSTDEIYKFMDTMQSTFFTTMDELMFEINNIHDHLIEVDNKHEQTISDIQHIHNLYATSNHPDFTNMNPNDESIPLNIDPNVIKAESTSLNFWPNTHTTDFKSTHSIKPPVVFDFGKWRKEIKYVNVQDEEFQTIESWYSDISQCIGLSTKEPTYLPDLVNITLTSTFRHLFGGYTSSTMREAGNEHYHRLSHALRAHLLHPKTWDSTKCTKIIQNMETFGTKKDGFKLLDD